MSSMLLQLSLTFVSLLLVRSHCSAQVYSYLADLNVTIEYENKQSRVEIFRDGGLFANHTQQLLVGILWSVQSISSHATANTGCTQNFTQLPTQTWIAFVKRGSCTFKTKVLNSLRNGAAGVVIYNSNKQRLSRWAYHVPGTVAVFIEKPISERMKHLIRLATEGKGKVYLEITPGTIIVRSQSNPIFIAKHLIIIALAIITMLCLAWIIYYYTRRWRIMHYRKQEIVKMRKIVRKVLSNISSKPLTELDKEYLSSSRQCAICLEKYRVYDVFRRLPCSHGFHRYCVDPWLIQQGKCPLCKDDITKYIIQANKSLKKADSQCSTDCGNCDSNVTVHIASKHRMSFLPIKDTESNAFDRIGRRFKESLSPPQPSSVPIHEINDPSSSGEKPAEPM